MPTAKRKVKTALIQMRVEPALKAAAEEAARNDHRNLTNWIEALILARVKEINARAIPKNLETQA